MSAYFTTRLLKWHAQNPRSLPWAGGSRDPYEVWISEIIMQQTRIEQGAPYYKKFIVRFPTVQSVASSSVNEVLCYWQGLGYYSRARNLHKTAQHIVQEYRGNFPRSYEALMRLPGVGSYTAAAIASFAYGLPHPVVDGNVKRLISRFSGITTPIDDAAAHKQIATVASGFMKGSAPHEFNQAIMNFGALVCKPKAPLCGSCPLSKKCFAFQHDIVEDLPVRSKTKANRDRYFHFIVVHYRNKILLQPRETKDIWQGLYVPPLLERHSTRSPSKNQIEDYVENITGHASQKFIGSTSPIQQILSHQTIHARFHHVQILSGPLKLSKPGVWVTDKTSNTFGKPKMITEMLKSHWNDIPHGS